MSSSDLVAPVQAIESVRPATLSTRLALAGLLGLALVLRLAFFTGFVGSDDSVYQEAAVELARNGRWTGQDLASSRLGMVGATAASIKLFGPTEFGTVALSLVASLLTHLLVYALARRYWDVRTALFAVLLLALCPLDIVYATILIPEPLLGAAMAAALLTYEVSLRGTTGAAAWAAAATGLLLGFAYLVKEPGILLLGAIGLTWVPTLVLERRLERRWFLVVGGFVGAMAIEAAIRQITTGTAFGRFQVSERAVAWGLANLEVERESSYWYLYFRSMFASVYQVGLFFYLFAAALIWAAVRRVRIPGLLLVWIVVMVGYLSFGSVSLTRYLPLPKQPRYLETVTVPVVLISAMMLGRLAVAPGRWPRRVLWSIIAVYAVTSLGAAALTSSLERWQFEPGRRAHEALEEARLVPVFASPRVANGLVELSGVTHVLHQWRGQACGIHDRFSLIVGAVPVGTVNVPPIPRADCSAWTFSRAVPVDPPRWLDQSLRGVQRVLQVAPIPRTTADKLSATIAKNAPSRTVRIFVPAGPAAR